MNNTYTLQQINDYFKDFDYDLCKTLQIDKCTFLNDTKKFVEVNLTTINTIKDKTLRNYKSHHERLEQFINKIENDRAAN